MSNRTIIGLSGQPVLVRDCTLDLCSLQYAQISYIPSQTVNTAYLVVLALLLLAQIVQLNFYRTWAYGIGIICGLVLEVIGYVARLGLHANPFKFSWFVMYLVALTIAPAFLAASIYLCLSRLVVVHGAHLTPVHPGLYTAFFICCDVISLVLQALGGGLAATAQPGQPNNGVNIMVGGLAFQVVSLSIFALACAHLAWRVHSAGGSHQDSSFTLLHARTLFKLFPYGLAVATVAIFTRSVFRVAELHEGFNGELANDEHLFNSLEGPMIIVAALALTVLHPGLCFGRASWQAANWTWTWKVWKGIKQPASLHKSEDSDVERSSGAVKA